MDCYEKNKSSDMDVDSMIDVVFKCKLCSMQTSTKDELRNHVISVHRRIQDSTGNVANTNDATNATPAVIEVEISGEPTIIGSKEPTIQLGVTSQCSRSGRKLRNKANRRFVYEMDEPSVKKQKRKGIPKKKKTSTKPAVKTTNQENIEANKGEHSSGKVSGDEKATEEDDCHPKISVEICKEISDFKCSKCDSIFLKESSLSKHIKKEHQKKQNVCPRSDCSFSTPNEEELALHTDSHYQNGFKCVMCDYSNSKWYRVKVHMEIHNAPTTHRCDDCGQSFSSPFALYNHRRFSHLGGANLCDECGFSAPSKYSLVQHKLTEHILQNVCHCGFKCDNEIDMNSHVKTRHTGGYVCKFCKEGNVTFRTQAELAAHTDSIHPGGKCYFCDKCNYVGKLRHHVTKHYHMHTGVRQYGCGHPGCSFRTKDHRNLKQHEIMKHKKPGELVCRACRYVTTNQNEWDIHQGMYHMQVYKCELCDYNSHSTSSIRRHKLAKHTSDESKRYPCQQCSYKTNFRECLQKHLLTHVIKDYTFKCLLCSATSSSREQMVQHMMEEHPDDRVYICEQCNYMSRKAYLLSLHSKSHSKEKPFSCSLCAYRGRTKALLRSHASHKHPPACSGKPETKSGAEKEIKNYFSSPNSNSTLHVSTNVDNTVEVVEDSAASINEGRKDSGLIFDVHQNPTYFSLTTPDHGSQSFDLWGDPMT